MLYIFYFADKLYRKTIKMQCEISANCSTTSFFIQEILIYIFLFASLGYSIYLIATEKKQKVILDKKLKQLRNFISVKLNYSQYPIRVNLKTRKAINEIEDEEEKNLIEYIINNRGSIYQSELVKETQHSKAKITRLLDKLEGKNLISRERRGMTNIVILKQL